MTGQDTIDVFTSTARRRPWRKRVIVLALLAGAGIAAWQIAVRWQREDTAPAYTLAEVTRGDIRSQVTASGTLNPLVQVQVGSQVSGRVKELHADFNDPALNALFKAIGTATPTQQRFMHLDATNGSYFASVSRVGSERTEKWYLATLVPENNLFGAMHRLGRDSIIASGAALAIAMGVALMFAWNILRMRRAVGVAREAARSAEARAKQLGSYKLVERLGVGGMGEVWRAEHQLLARRAAIKLVRPEVLRDRTHAGLIQERFRREAQTLASMTSRHTIALYDYGVTDEGTFFYVMELLDGLDLSMLVREYGPQPAARRRPSRRAPRPRSRRACGVSEAFRGRWCR
jgi:hypothetical protein